VVVLNTVLSAAALARDTFVTTGWKSVSLSRYYNINTEGNTLIPLLRGLSAHDSRFSHHKKSCLSLACMDSFTV
jgi:uracil DNA glycosylase